MRRSLIPVVRMAARAQTRTVPAGRALTSSPAAAPQPPLLPVPDLALRPLLRNLRLLRGLRAEDAPPAQVLVVGVGSSSLAAEVEALLDVGASVRPVGDGFGEDVGPALSRLPTGTFDAAIVAQPRHLLQPGRVGDAGSFFQQLRKVLRKDQARLGMVWLRASADPSANPWLEPESPGSSAAEAVRENPLAWQDEMDSTLFQSGFTTLLHRKFTDDVPLAPEAAARALLATSDRTASAATSLRSTLWSDTFLRLVQVWAPRDADGRVPLAFHAHTFHCQAVPIKDAAK